MTLNNISIVTCSKHDSKFRAFKKNILRIFGVDVDIVRVDDAKSMAEGYNRALKIAGGDIIIFCHDDVEFLSNDTPKNIMEDLRVYDIVGVAGTNHLSEGRWHVSGKEYVHGQVAHVGRAQCNEYQICRYGMCDTEPIVGAIQALDGLFFAVTRDVAESIGFDESFDGFHLYDLDFTYTAYLKGYRIAVDHRIHLLHKSGGRYDQIWATYFDMFNTKYFNILALKKCDPTHEIQKVITHYKGNLNTLMRKHYSDCA